MNTRESNNVYNDILMSCKYHTEQQLNYDIQLTKTIGISLIHFNARSLNKNIDKIIYCIHALECSFYVIAIIETWMYQTSSVQGNIIPVDNMVNAFELARDVEMLHCT